MKKGIFCLVLGITGLALMSCDDKDSNNWSSLCGTMFEQSPYASTDLLTKDQKNEIREISIDECVNYYDNLPACESEYYDYLDCYVNTYESFENISEAEWEELEAKKLACANQYPEEEDEDKYKECMIKFYPCASEEIKVDECAENNEDNYALIDKYSEDYEAQHEEGEDPIDKLLEEWGIDYCDISNDCYY